MTSLITTVFCIILFSRMTVRKAQETRESLFLDTTLLPAVELSIRNTARPLTVSTIPVKDVTSMSETTKVHDRYSSVIEATVSSSTRTQNTAVEAPQNSNPSLRGALVHSEDLTSHMVGFGFSSPSTPWDSSLMPSFTTASHSVITQEVSSTLHKNTAASLPEISESSVSMPDVDRQQTDASVDDRITATYLIDGTSKINSDMLIEKSVSDVTTEKSSKDVADENSSDAELNRGSNNFELSGETPALASSVDTPNMEFVTPTSWLFTMEPTKPTSWNVFESESLNNGHSMLYGSQFDDAITSTSPNATDNETDYTWFEKGGVITDRQDRRNHNGNLYSKRLDFVLKKRCSDDHTLLRETFGRLNVQLVELLNSTVPLNENQSIFICERIFHLTVSIKNMTDDVIKKNIKNLTESFNFSDNFRLEKIHLYQNEHAKILLFSADAPEQTISNVDEYALSERELIAYIIAGVSLATLLFILLTCCCVRFLCKKQTTSLDLCDIPHLNLKLEDYKLTPIPRPTISFSEYGRELFNPSYSEHTSKLEDTILSKQHFAAELSSPVARESMSFPREMRTFGGKKPCSRVQSLDSRPNTRSGNGWISNSREKLSTDFERRNSGFDNVGFRKWF